MATAGDSPAADAEATSRKVQEQVDRAFNQACELLKPTTLLQPHQPDGVRWMLEREIAHGAGGFICDEMGLGKTVQTIGGILGRVEVDVMARSGEEDELKFAGIKKDLETYEAVKNGAYKGGTLIIAPKEVLNEWKDKLEKHAGVEVRKEWNGAVAVSMNRKLDYVEVKAGIDPDLYTTEHVVLCSFDMLCQPWVINTLREIKFMRIVADESHGARVRDDKTRENKDTTRWKNLMQLNACYKWALSGSPVHKFPEDFTAQAEWIGLSEDDISAILEDDNADVKDTWIKRRTKAEVAHARPRDKLPDCHDHVVRVVLVHDGEIALEQNFKDKYAELINQGREELRKRGSSAGKAPGSAGMPAAFKQIRNTVTANLLALRNPQCFATSSYVLTTPTKKRDADGKPINSVAALAALLPPGFVDKKSGDWIDGSTKLERIVEVVDTIVKQKRKLLIFSGSKKELDAIEAALQKVNIKTSKLEGGMKKEAKDSQLRLWKTKKDRNVLLINDVIGSEGMNLQEASAVLLTQPLWNPQKEDQCIARAWRTGQTRSVDVYRFIVANSIEETVVQRAESRRATARRILGDDKRLADLLEAAAEGGAAAAAVVGAPAAETGAAEHDGAAAGAFVDDEPTIEDLVKLVAAGAANGGASTSGAAAAAAALGKADNAA